MSQLRRHQLHPYQQAIVNHIQEGAESLLLVEVGLGKTVSVLTGLQDMIDEDRRDGRDRRALILAPKRVATSVWKQEVAKWEHLHLRVGVAAGLSPTGRLKMLTDPRYDVVTLNYENIPWLCQKFPRETIKDHFYFLVMDEIDKMKDPGTKRFSVFRHKAKHFAVKIGMTGTPASESIEDIWGPSFLVTDGKALGSSHQAFRRAHFQPVDPNGWKWEPRPGAIAHVAKQLDPYTYRARAKDHLDLPPLIPIDISFELPPEARRMYADFERDLVLALERGDVLNADEHEWSDDVEVDASNAAVLKNKLRQICSGFTYRTTAGQRFAYWLHKEKIQALANLRSELMSEQLMVVYGFQAEYQNIPLDGRLGGGISDREAEKYIDDWNAGSLATLGMHPASAGHGLNLQQSGAHHIAFLTLPWSRALYDQTVGRLHRMGQANTVFVHRFIAADTVEEDVMRALDSKGSVQERVIEAIRGRIARA